MAATTYRGHTSDFIQRHVYVYGQWEPGLTSVFRDRLRYGDVAIDVGANWGYFTMLAARAVGTEGHVVAVEALPSAVQTLRAALDRNLIKNVTVQHCAAGAHQGSIEVFRGTPSNLGHSGTRSELGHTSEGIVPLQPLDALIDQQLVPRLRIIKIDTEGDEVAVLAGLQRTLLGMRPGSVVLVEVSPDLLAARNSDPAQITRLLPAAEWESFRVPNDYDVASYVSSASGPIRPHHGPIEERVDLMFVKREAVVAEDAG